MVVYMQKFIDFLSNETTWKTLLDFYLIFLLFIFILKIVLTNKKLIAISTVSLFLIVLGYLIIKIDLPISKQIVNYFKEYGVLVILIIMAPELNKLLEKYWRKENKVLDTTITRSSKELIVEACEYLSARKIGALITIEKHTSLDQYAEKAIQMNCDISKEVLINIFTPLTPLHDGAVIISGNKIRCAAAYFVLTDNDQFDKTMGSRHRAGVGISEVSDSLTIIVSEQTGQISIALGGVKVAISDREKLLSYLEMV